MTTFTLNLNAVGQLNEERFFQLCQDNPEIKFERNIDGELLIMAPTGGETGHRNIEIAADFVIWNRRAGLGVCFDSSTGFKLPNGADRSPDVAWIRKERWQALTPQQREKFPPIAPDFVLELMSPTDELSIVREKMLEYRDNGVRLGWLIDPKKRRVEVYRPGREVDVLDAPALLSGEEVLPGFNLALEGIWG
jgi:Uma2 family endonuclease